MEFLHKLEGHHELFSWEMHKHLKFRRGGYNLNTIMMKIFKELKLAYCADKKIFLVSGTISLLLIGLNLVHLYFEINEVLSIGEFLLSLINLSGSIILLVLIAKNTLDNYKKKQFEKAMMQSNKLASIGEMSSSIAHEINNPLAIISLRISKIETKMTDMEDGKELENINKINLQIKRITKIINGLKSYARDSDDDSYTLNSLNEIVKSAVELASERIESNGIKLDLNIENNVFIECSSVQIEQVLINLINNSIDAISSLDEKWIKVKISPEAEAEAEVIISDSGHGIPIALQEKIMEPFFTTKEVGKGTGLGLSISMGIIEKHGGLIYYDKNAPHTTFVIKLKKSISFDLAIKNHLAWKSKLERYITNPNKSLNVEDVLSDCKCSLGKWIYQQEENLKELAEWKDLKEKHSKFHLIAGAIVLGADNGTRSSEFLEENSLYSKTSDSTINAINELKNKLSQNN